MIVVTGATGTVGRHVVSLLLEQGASVRAVTRDSSRVMNQGAEVVQADPTRPETMADAMKGAAALFLSPPAVGGASAPLLELAGRRGVKKVVMLSSAAVDDTAAVQTNPIAALHRTIEESVEASGVDWTFVRPDMFATNTIRFWGAGIRQKRSVRAAFGDAALAPIDERDVAAVAVRALLSDDLVGRHDVITGPESLTQRRLAELIGAAIGQPISFVELSPSEALRELTAVGVPTGTAEALLEMHRRAVDSPTPVSDVPTRVLGRPAYTFAEWARRHAADFQ